MYEELICRLRAQADEWCPNCCYKHEKYGCLAPIEEKHYCDSAPMREAADILEKLSEPKWIPVTEQLPEDETYVLISFKRNMAVAYRKVGRWHVMCGGGWKTTVSLLEQQPTHWMPLPEPPEEEKE